MNSPRATQRTGLVPLAAGIVATFVAVVPLAAAGALGSQASEPTSDGSRCITAGPLPGLASGQAQNARIVAAVAQARAGAPAVVIALMTGLAESGLRVLGNPSDASAAGLATQGEGFDHDSLGIFQQRPSWGSAQQRLDPVASTNLFLDRLLANPGWRTAAPWQSAQSVQISAYDGDPRPANNFSATYGGNYLAVLPEATQLTQRISVDAAAFSCRGDSGSNRGVAPSGAATVRGLPVGFAIPPTTAAAREAVTAALQQLGKPYVFGAAGPTSFDCSGLTQWAWARAGVALPHYTGAQLEAGSVTDAAHLLPGDLVLVPGSDGTLADPQHVGMFIGEGLVVEAPQTGDVVKVVTYSSFVSGGLSGLRHIA